MEAADEAIEQVALSSGVTVTGNTTAVIVSSSTWRQVKRGEGLEIADDRQALVLACSMQDKDLLA